MQLYLDTGNTDEVRKWIGTGVVDGVTTNPSLIAKEGRDFEQTIKEIIALFVKVGKKDFTVSAEVTTLTATEMVMQARHLAALDPHVVVKVPITIEGIAAITTLSKENIRTNATLCFSVSQALLAAKAGAYFVSPFVGRLDDAGEDGMALIRRIRTVYNQYGFATKLLTASVRSTEHVAAAAEAGSDIATVPPAIFTQLFEHPLTDAGLKKFMDDWAKHEKR